jgi:hypothetical protein
VDAGSGGRLAEGGAFLAGIQQALDRGATMLPGVETWSDDGCSPSLRSFFPA